VRDCENAYLTFDPAVGGPMHDAVMLLRASCPRPFGPAFSRPKSLPAILSSRRTSSPDSPRWCQNPRAPDGYHGVFAPASPDRGRVVPGTRAASVNQVKECGEASAIDRQRSLTWAQRLKCVFATDIEVCRPCGGRPRVIASIGEQATIDRILEHPGRAGESGDRAHPRQAKRRRRPSRAPPQGDLSL
jgi:hypothetical protein